jgi:hypothetical protein
VLAGAAAGALVVAIGMFVAVLVSSAKAALQRNRRRNRVLIE